MKKLPASFPCVLIYVAHTRVCTHGVGCSAMLAHMGAIS